MPDSFVYSQLTDSVEENDHMETASYILLVLALGAAIFFWGRGIRNGRKSDLIAGPAILLALCVALFAVNGSSAVFEPIGGLLIVFGVATLLLSLLVRPGGAILRRNVIAIGAGAIIAGGCLAMII
jgi:peptidoglycan/LPS O-acetylase OafA/YrhL